MPDSIAGSNVWLWDPLWFHDVSWTAAWRCHCNPPLGAPLTVCSVKSWRGQWWWISRVFEACCFRATPIFGAYSCELIFLLPKRYRLFLIQESSARSFARVRAFSLMNVGKNNHRRKGLEITHHIHPTDLILNHHLQKTPLKASFELLVMGTFIQFLLLTVFGVIALCCTVYHQI